ncbi:uncharacterized protein LTR77_008890 [Saxophila tyrrhenica]|uniref:Major facilitator superfamily (MFS) profile domain-containing protein n=1 Tax=Saxophila tyrrhenica TaxID=1690608 RepID=A0AAV9P1U6_9PEZI|nr:hypothetical protein LTR77_008890 [Saxophila tyrrhenica]
MKATVGSKTGSARPTSLEIPAKQSSCCHASHPASKDVPPPDAGFRPWLQVVAGFILMFNAWGVVVSYGAFQTFYTSSRGLTDESESVIAWIGSAQNFLLLFGGALGGKYFDAGYYRQMLYAGTFLVVFGLMMTSLATQYYQALLAQGFCVGLGLGLLLVPSVGLPSTWFQKRRGLAVGIVSTGASFAGITFPVALRKLIMLPAIGFGWAVRVLGFTCLGTLSISIVLGRPRLPPRPRGAIVEYKALKQLDFAFYVAGQFVTYLGFFTFYNYVENWAISMGLDDRGLPLMYVLPILNAASILGRSLPPFIADYTGALNIQVPATYITGVLLLAWIPVDSLGATIALSTLYGFSSGAALAIIPTATACMTKDMRTFGGQIGVVFVAMAVSTLIGTPIAGAIIQSSGYDSARIWAGVVVLCGATLTLIARLVKSEWRLLAKPLPLFGPFQPPPVVDASSDNIESLANDFRKTLNSYVAESDGVYGPISINTTSCSLALSAGSNYVPKESNPRPYFFEYHHSASNLDEDDAQDAETEWAIGDLTQIFTTISLLAGEGDEVWARSITEYLPELKASNVKAIPGRAIVQVAWEDVTLGALASHMAGIVRDCKFSQTLRRAAEAKASRQQYLQHRRALPTKHPSSTSSSSSAHRAPGHNAHLSPRRLRASRKGNGSTL